MLAVVTGTVLQARARNTNDGKAYVDIYLLQDGERQPVVAYAEAADLPTLPTPGEVVEASVQCFVSKFAGGSLSVKVTAIRSAQYAV